MVGERRERPRERDGRTVVAGRESDAARAPKRRRAGHRHRQAAPSESHPGRSSGASVSQPTLRDAVIISIVCPPFLRGRGGLPTALAFVPPRSLFRLPCIFFSLLAPAPALSLRRVLCPSSLRAPPSRPHWRGSTDAARPP